MVDTPHSVQMRQRAERAEVVRLALPMSRDAAIGTKELTAQVADFDPRPYLDTLYSRRLIERREGTVDGKKGARRWLWWRVGD